MYFVQPAIVYYKKYTCRYFHKGGHAWFRICMDTNIWWTMSNINIINSKNIEDSKQYFWMMPTLIYSCNYSQISYHACFSKIVRDKLLSTIINQTHDFTHWDQDTLADILQTIFSNAFLWMKISVHDDVIKWKHFPCYWPFVWEIHRSPRTKAIDSELWCFRWSAPEQPVLSGWVSNRDGGDLTSAYYDVTVMILVQIHWRVFPKIKLKTYIGSQWVQWRTKQMYFADADTIDWLCTRVLVK